MPEILTRVGVLVLVSLLLWLMVWTGQRFVEARHKRALATELPAMLANVSNGDTSVQWVTDISSVRILAFSSADCRQCHTLQEPALRSIIDARGAVVSVIEVDAPSSPELVQSYQVLTVPTTVVLDAAGHAHAVNYGFANTQRLLAQVDAVLAQGTTL